MSELVITSVGVNYSLISNVNLNGKVNIDNNNNNWTMYFNN